MKYATHLTNLTPYSLYLHVGPDRAVAHSAIILAMRQDRLI